VKREPVRITLSEPIVLRSAQTGAELDRIAVVTFREPRAGDMAAAMDAGGKDGGGTMILALAARCTGLTRAQVEDLSVDDFMALSEVATGFLGTGPATGKTASGSSSAPSASLPAGSDGARPSSGS
jgi:hypothetical protein